MIFENKVFYVYRCSIIFNRQRNLFEDFGDYEESPSFRNKLFHKLFTELIHDVPIKMDYRNSEYILIPKVIHGFVYLQLGKQKIYDKDILLTNKFDVTQDVSHPNIDILINRETQEIYIQYKKEPFSTISSAVAVITYFLNSLITQDFTVELMPSSETKNFWNVIEKYQNDLITSVSFELLAPNFLDASSNAADIVKMLHKDKNVEKFEISLYSETGILIDKSFNSYVDYTSSGAGRWKLKVKEKGKKRKILIKQDDNIKKTKFDLVEENGKYSLKISLVDGDLDENN